MNPSFAKVDIVKRQPCLYLIVDTARDADSPRFRKLLQPGCDIHAVAIDGLLIGEDVAEAGVGGGGALC